MPDEGPPSSRRDLLRLLAAGSVAGLSSTALAENAAPATDAAATSRTAQERQVFTGRVQDVNGRRLTTGETGAGGTIEEIEAVATRVPADPTEYLDGDLHGIAPVTTTRTGDGRFTIDPTGSGPVWHVRDDDRYVHVTVRVRVDPPEGDRTVTWFDAGTFGVDEFRGGEGRFTVDRRLLVRDDAPLAIWQRVRGEDAEYPFEIDVERRGYYRTRERGDDPETEERAEIEPVSTDMESGLVTLQAPEDVTIGYRDAPDAPWPLEPDGYYTDDIGEAEERATELAVLERGQMFASATDSLAETGANWPLFPAFRSGDRSLYEPYNDGQEERDEENLLDDIFDTINFVLFLASFASTGGTLSVALTVLGPTLGAIKSGAVDGPEDLPTSATGGQTYRDGTLPATNKGYDFVSGQWRWPTYGFVQPFPVRFENDVPGAFCVRTLVDAGEVTRSEQAFVVDPTVRSPLQERGLTVPDGSAALMEPPTPVIEVSDWSPTAGDTVTFDASGSSGYRDIDLVSYDWTVVPPSRDSKQYVDVDGDGTADLVGPRGYEAPRTETQGATVSRTFEVAGTYDVSLTVTDETGRTATRRTTVNVEPAPKPEILPTEAAVDDCYFPPTGESAPATGAGAARHFGYGCGDWKVYHVIPGEAYTVAATVDDCADCLLHDASFVVEEPANPGNGVPLAEKSWTETRRQEQPLGKAWGGETFELAVVPDAEFVRIRNLDAPDSAGVGFYASVYGPRPEGGGSEGTTDAGSDEPLSNE